MPREALFPHVLVAPDTVMLGIGGGGGPCDPGDAQSEPPCHGWGVGLLSISPTLFFPKGSFTAQSLLRAPSIYIKLAGVSGCTYSLSTLMGHRFIHKTVFILRDLGSIFSDLVGISASYLFALPSLTFSESSQLFFLLFFYMTLRIRKGSCWHFNGNYTKFVA